MERKAYTWERVRWEIARGISTMPRSAFPFLLLMQLAVFIFVGAKGAGQIYANMILILLAISTIGWILNSMIRGNQKILLYTLMLLTIGVMLQCTFKSESLLAHPEMAQGNASLYLQVQYGLALAAACFMGFLYYNYSRISTLKTCRFFMILSISISMLTLLLAKSVGNVRNWIVIGGISLQTTELIKLIYLLVAASLLGTPEGPSKTRQRLFVFFSLINMGFLAIQSEFGTLLLLTILFLIYIFLFIPDIKVFIKTSIVMASVVLAGILCGNSLQRLSLQGSPVAKNALIRIFLRNYDKIANRIVFWMHPDLDPQGLGYQLIQARNSILLGGWFGSSSVTDLPVKTSDLVYPALIQRCGMVFGALVFLLFILICLEGIRLFVRKQDAYHCALAAGITFMLFAQSLIIIAGSTGLCPLTGITLPLISSGGSSLLVTATMVGILLTISGNVSWEGMNHDEEEFYKESAAFAKCSTYLRHFHVVGLSQSLRDSSRIESGSRSKKDQSKAGFLSKRIYKGKHTRQKRNNSGQF